MLRVRGLAFIGDFAVVGLSKPRGNKTFSGLALDDNLTERDAEARCGLLVIDLRSGDIVHWVRIGGVVDVQKLATRLARAPAGNAVASVALRLAELANERGHHVRRFQIEVIAGSVKINGDHVDAG